MEQLNPGQIKKTIKQLKQREQEYLYYLGQLAYQAGEQGKLEDAGMLEAYRTLKEIQVQISQCGDALEQIKAVREAAQKPRCPHCGEPLARGAAFCARCGASLAAPPPAASPQANSPAGQACTHCGAALEEDAVFCGNCGARSGAIAKEDMPPLEETHACPKCGTVASEAGVQFCSVCGTGMSREAAEEGAAAQTTEAEPAGPVEAAPQVTAGEGQMPALEETHACPKCGAGIPDKDMVFCSVCGSKVRE